jgi:hypothetical protein
VNRITVILLGTLAVQPLAAQVVMRPAPKLDSARAEIRDVLWRLRDSLLTVDGAAARLQRDYRVASGPALVARARLMTQAYARSFKAVAPARSVVVSANPTSKQKVQQRKLLRAFDSLSKALNVCETEFARMSRADQGETVRGYGNDRAGRVVGALRTYEHSLSGFLRAMGIPYEPAGLNPGPVSG